MKTDRLQARIKATAAMALRWAPLLVLPLVFAIPALAAEGGFVQGLSTYPLREEPQFSAEPTMRLPVGQELSILEQQQGWVRVRVGDRTGWMPTSVVGNEAPANLQLGPLQDRMRDMNARIEKLGGENKGLKDENAGLADRVSSLTEDLERVQNAGSKTRNLQKLRLIALGGGFVIFGWVTGYALAAAVHRPGSKKKYIID